jgi:hypothetical protein
MRDGWLGEPHAFFNVAGAQSALARGTRTPLFKRSQDAAPRRIGNGMERSIERWDWTDHGLDHEYLLN